MAGPVRTGYQPPADSALVSLPASPEPLSLKASETAVIVVDMQNAYATEGGYVDIAGFDVGGAAAAVTQTKKVLDAARAAGITVIFFQNGWDKDYRRGRHAGLAELAQVQRAEDHAGPARTCRHAAGQRHLGLCHRRRA